MFDTGAHMMNTVCLLADSDFEQVSALMNNRERSVDVVCAVVGRLASGALLTLNAAGDGPVGCASHLTFFYSGRSCALTLGAPGGRSPQAQRREFEKRLKSEKTR